MAVAQERFDFSSIPVIPPIVSRKSGAHHRLESGWAGHSTRSAASSRKIQDGLLVGPTERYDVGNLLVPHVLARALDLSKVRCAGMARADFKDVGGFPVRNYGESALEMGGSNLHLVHTGGRSLTEDIVDAYSSVVKAEEAERFESLRLIGDEAAVRSYVRRRTGQLGDLAYLLSPEGEFFGCRTSFLSVDLSNLEALEPESLERLMAALRESDFVGVGDAVSEGLLENQGIHGHRMPSSLSVLPQLCARQLKESRDSPAMAEVKHRFPNGWIAVEIGEVEDRYFERLGQALHEVSERDGLGLVFFDAKEMGEGTETTNLRRWVEFHPEWEAAQFSSSNIWDVASLLLHSRLHCGGNLDCRNIAMGGGVPRVGVPSESKSTRNYCELWENSGLPTALHGDEDWSAGLTEALRVDFTILADHARQIGERYFDALQSFSAATGIQLRC